MSETGARKALCGNCCRIGEHVRQRGLAAHAIKVEVAVIAQSDRPNGVAAFVACGKPIPQHRNRQMPIARNTGALSPAGTSLRTPRP